MNDVSPKNADPTAAKADILRQMIARLAKDGEPYALLDFPDYSNVGDSAIYLGELALLKAATGLGPKYVTSLRSFTDDINRQLPVGTIYLQGGGNFGDLWRMHQDFREAILLKHRDRKIVQLPQSIFFQSEKGLDQCAKVIAQHPDFTLLVRDDASFAIARSKFDCTVLKCPDAAFALGPLKKTVPQEYPILAMLRTDHEGGLSPEDQKEIEALCPVRDWVIDTPDMKSRRDRFIESAFRKIAPSRPFLDAPLGNVYERWARARLDRGIAQLSAAQFVITDRLHVHVLCELLGIPHLVFDNSYGKISGFIDAWPKSDLGVLVTSMEAFRDSMQARH